MRVVPNVFQCCKNFDVLQKAAGDLLALRVVIKILQAEDFALPGEGELRIEGGPVDFVTELDAGKLEID